MTTQPFHWMDVAVVCLYMAGMLVLGAWFMRRQKSAYEFLLASRGVGWFAIGLSLLASLNSAVDYVIGPAQILEFGFMNLVWIVPVFLSFPIIFKYFLPFYQRLRLYNCYEYLERRFDVGVRLVATTLFIVWRISWMGTTIYLPAYVLHVVMGFNLYGTIILLGIVTTIYTTLGGVRGVVWTDVAQALIMFAGLIGATWLVIDRVPGGVAEIWAVSREKGFMYFTAQIPEMGSAAGWSEKVTLYFQAPLTFWSIILIGTFSKLTSYGADQVMVQRYLTAKSIHDSKTGFVLNTVAYIVYSLLFIVLGMALFAYFTMNPLPEHADYGYIFPYFIANHMPVVFRGLIIAAIYAAAQSSVGSGIAAATAAIFSDFYMRLVHGKGSSDDRLENIPEARKVFFSRLCALGLGLCVTVFACLFKELAESSGLFAAFRKVVGIFEGLIIPLFILGMFSRRVGRLGVYAGVLAGFAASFYWGFFTNLGFGWNTAVAFVITIVVAYLVSLIEKTPGPEKIRWVWSEIMARPEPGEV